MCYLLHQNEQTLKILKKLGFFFISVLILTFCFWLAVKTYLKPQYSGTRTLEGLDKEVSVYFDDFGIPHIYGNNERDVFRALGYVHAQDRLWQMELLRRIGKGGLSEVFGKDLVQTDRFFLSLGIEDASLAATANLNPQLESTQLLNAYLDGINQFVAVGPKPIEFYLTGLAPQPFTTTDVYNILGYMAFSFAQAHKTDPLLTAIKDKLGTDYLLELGIDISPSSTLIKNHAPGDLATPQNTMPDVVMASLKKLSIPLFEGSNSWVISPSKTKNGKVIFANDPHIGFAQPAVWYEAHLVTPNYEKYGYHLAGVPFPLLGHDRNLAYGMTMFENDDIDFHYIEQHPTDSTKYKLSDHWEDYIFITKTIKIKDAEDYRFTYKQTQLGPVLNNIAKEITGDRPIGMSWIYTQRNNKLIEALKRISFAKNISEFQAALPDIHAPGLNMMYGDAQGNIAWWATAHLYKIPKGVQTKFIQDTNSRLALPKEFLDFKENPQAINPPWGYVYSANNQPDSIAGMLYPGYYLPENRAKRIVEMLEPKNDWDAQSVQHMITDVTSKVNAAIMKDLLKSVDIANLSENQIAILDGLNNWQGEYTMQSVEATVFHSIIDHFLKNTFKDELGEEMYAQLTGTHLFKRLSAPLASKSSSVWWDDIATLGVVETKNDILQKSVLEAFASLEENLGEATSHWAWGRVHTLEHGHPIGQIGGLAKRFFNVGPFAVPGTSEVINNMSFEHGDISKHEVTTGPSTRRVIDFSAIDNSYSILPTGQSGNPFSAHYRDQAQMYVNGTFRKMLMDKEEIIEKSESILIFNAMPGQ